MDKIVSRSEGETVLFAEKLAESLKAGDVVALFGDLGAGKTAFTKGIAKHFGICGVQSPTFSIVNEYHGSVTVYHFDAYRINTDDWLNSGFDEYLFGDGVCVIEWAENISGILPENTVKVSITKGDDENCRIIEVKR